jgi:isopenicillin N synthase-like dioxygenase
MGQDLALDDPLVVNRRFFMGPNVWPPASVLREEDFKQPVERYYAAVSQLALKVMEMVARTLPYGADVFKEFTSKNIAAPLRLLHYPPARKTEQRQLGASAHTDFGAVTLLLQDENEGLEVLNTKTNEYVAVKPNPSGYVVNIADLLSKWTNNAYKSSWHRVINKNPWDRYSIVFFFNGNLDCELAPLDGSKAEGKVGTVESHLVDRMNRSYGKS